MIRKTVSFPIVNGTVLKEQMLHWVNRFNICSFLDNHQYSSAYGTVECLAAAGAVSVIDPLALTPAELSESILEKKDWLFGHISYDYKNQIEPLVSLHPDPIGFPDIFLFQPETVLSLQDGELVIASVNRDPAAIYQELTHLAISPPDAPSAIAIQPRIKREEYVRIVEELLRHILRGDCYEINFCQEFYARDVQIHPLHIYHTLTGISPNPFSCYYKLGDKHLLCASPERYLQKTGRQLVSQPIKGTYRRNRESREADEQLKKELRNSEKERSENVMVVDLVRNDLSRVCKEGTVKVEELFGIYSFPQVHQMISTISGELKEGMELGEILQASFPMGSMTGAPKRRVMELIEQYEKTKRGIYSGAVGYIHPGGDFDFNVVIRSILYNASNKYLNYLVGGGITYHSNPEKEYEECLLKAAAIREVLQSPSAGLS